MTGPRALLLGVGLCLPGAQRAVLDRGLWTWDPALYGELTLTMGHNVLSGSPVRPPLFAWAGLPAAALVRALGGGGGAGALPGADTALILSQLIFLVGAIALCARATRARAGLAPALLLAGAPLTVGLAQQLFPETSLLFAVTLALWAVAGPLRGGPRALALVTALALALLAKALAPLYLCVILPHGLWLAWRDGAAAGHGRRWLAAAVSSALAATAWYGLHWQAAMGHYLEGRANLGVPDLIVALRGLQQSALHPVLIGALAVGLWWPVRSLGPVDAPGQDPAPARAPALLWVLLAQVMVVVAVMALSGNREPRLYLPVIPVLAFALAELRPRRPRWVLCAIAAQYAWSYLLVLNVADYSPHLSHWLEPPEQTGQPRAHMNDLLGQVCAASMTVGVVGGLPVLNRNTLAFTALLEGRPCTFTLVTRAGELRRPLLVVEPEAIHAGTSDRSAHAAAVLSEQALQAGQAGRPVPSLPVRYLP